MNKLSFLAGAALGYILGTRAGRSQYEDLKRRADALWHDPRVQDKVTAAGQTVKDKAPEVKSKLVDAAGQATSAVKDKVAAARQDSDAAQPTDPTGTTDDQLIGSEPGSDYTPHETKFQS